MSEPSNISHENPETLARGGHRPHGPDFQITIDGESYSSSDPIVSGRQLLNLAGKRPVEEHLIYILSRDGLLEDISLEERVDLRRSGKERFLTFLSDRSYRFELDSKRQDWGASIITETTLKRLANVPAEYRVWMERRNEEDLLLDPGQTVDLSGPEVERFYTGSDATTAGSVEYALPSADRRYLADHGIKAEVSASGNQVGVVIPRYELPGIAVTPRTVDLLIILPPGYPDSGPDMFYLYPWVQTAAGQWPNQADHSFQFAGRSWQRWSRHSNVWRGGVDGIWTMLRRVDAAVSAVPCAA